LFDDAALTRGRPLLERPPGVESLILWHHSPPMITFSDFEKVEIRVGRIVKAETFPEARKPAYKLVVDFGGSIGLKRSSAQLTEYYTPETLEGRLVMAVVNMPPRQIGPFVSEVLTLGVPDGTGAVVLMVPERDVPLGGKLF
jgi:tRNA-binding protein